MQNEALHFLVNQGRVLRNLSSETLESWKEEDANFLQTQDIENIIALTIANITRTVCFVNALLYFNKWL